MNIYVELHFQWLAKTGGGVVVVGTNLRGGEHC